MELLFCCHSTSSHGQSYLFSIYWLVLLYYNVKSFVEESFLLKYHIALLELTACIPHFACQIFYAICSFSSVIDLPVGDHQELFSQVINAENSTRLVSTTMPGIL